MSAFPIPPNEEERLQALRRYQILDTLPEAAFDRITRTAANFFNVPVALVSLVDKNRQWMKSTCGLDVCETSRETAFCAHTIIENEPLIVEDATLDPRFAANPLVTGIPGIRFYAGAPLRTSDGHNLGSLCVIDMQPRACSDLERAALIDLAATVIDLMELRLAHQKLNLEFAARASAQEQIRSSEEKFRSVTQSVGDGIVSSDQTGKIIFWNLGAEKIFGHREEEILGQPLTAIMPERFRTRHTAGMARLQAGGEARVLGRTVELFGLHKSGREFPLELTLSSWTSGRETFYTGILRDITERARASEELKRSEARLAEAQEIARIGSWELDLATKKPIWSDQFYRLLGLVPGEEEPNFERLVSCIHPDDREAFRLATERLIATKQLSVIDLRIVQPDGRIRVVQRRGSADLDAEGKVIRLVGTMQDITERKQAEERLQKEREVLAAVLENVADGIVSCDAEGELAISNRATRTIHGLPPERIASREWAAHFDLYLPDGKTLMQKDEIPLVRALAGETVRDVEMVVAPKNGLPKRRLLASGQSFFDAQGKKLGAVVAMHDVTAYKAAQGELQASVDRLHMLYDITSRADLNLEAKIRKLLEMTRRELALECGLLAQVEGDQYTIREAVPRNGTLPPGFVCVLGETICQEVLRRNEPLAFEKAGEWKKHPAHKNFPVESYLGVPVPVLDGTYGVICFTDARPRSQKFSAAETEFVRLLAQWIGGEMDRRTIECALKEAKEAALRLELEATRREGEERYTFLADTMPQIVWTARRDGGLDYYNKAWFDYTGMTLEQTKDWGWGAVLHPDDLERCIDCWTKSFTTGEPYEIEYRFKRASDGAYRWHLGRALAMRNDDGEIVQWVGTCTDIDDQKRSRARLEARVAKRTNELALAKAQLQSVLDAATGVSVIATDLEGMITLFNSGSQAMLGYGAEEMIGRQTPAILHLPAEVEARGTELTNILDRPIAGFDVFVEIPRLGEPEEREWTYVRKDGSHLAVALVVSASHNAAGEINGFLGIALDITERRNAREQLERAKEAAESANRAKSEFLANMSHEIRTPMNGIIGMTDLTLETKLNREQREYLGMVKSSAHSLLQLINDILDFSKIEAGKMILESIGFNLRDCLSGTLRPLAIRAEQKEIELVTDLPVDLPDYLIGDPMRLRQVLINLTDNAIKFTPRGEVTVRVARERAGEREIGLHFCVIDTGIGIAPEKQALIFEAFAQADGSTTRDFGGTGLGLTIASQIVRQMGGRIWVESESGQGTTFHFTVRLGLPDNAAASVPTSAGPTKQSTSVAAECTEADTKLRLRILLAEDNAINCAVATAMLNKMDHVVVHAANGKEALKAMESAEFDLVLMDLQMPEMDGFEATRLVREKESACGRRTPIVAMTAHAMQGDRERCLAAGLDGYLAKPVDKAKLFETIRATLLAKEVSEKESAPLPGADFSVAALLEQLDGNEKLLRKLAALFAEHTPALLRQIDVALRTGDLELLSRVTHQLSGSLGNLRALGAAEITRDLDEAMRTGDPARARKLAKLLNQEADAIRARFAEHESRSVSARAAIGAAP
ncbi:MAG: PAS domain S-box protein [Chthoniobacterales bacterium]|nr:PAS domain S-box protein [Chthoniobacterales bacterium]